MSRIGFVLLLVLAGVAPAYAQSPAPPPWDPRFSNPKPASGDLSLPIPCGGAIVFRPVAVPYGSGALDDRPIQLGNPDAQLGFNEYQRGAFLAAPFRTPDGTAVFYLGKYDVTRDQYAAVMTGTCPQASARGRTAQATVSWFEAVEFTQRLSAWLLANAADKLPRHDQAPAFVRLPTEEEWEYAARGGAAVSDSDYLAPTWPMPEGPERYAIAGAEMSEGQAQQVGQLLPNPLGLYDMLGNVEQWVLEPYRLNRVGRLQGMAGGVVTRGDSYATPLEELRTSARAEIPPFDPVKKAPTRLATVGFRVALSSVAGGGLQDVAKLKQAFATLEHANPTGTDPRSRIAQLKQQWQDPALQRALDALGADLAANERAQADARRQTVHADLNAATALCYVVWRVQEILNGQQKILDQQQDLLRQQQADPNNPAFRGLNIAATVQAMKAGMARNQAEQQTALDAYGELLRQAVADGATPLIGDEAQVVTREMVARADRRRLFVDIASKHLTAIGGGQALASEAMLKDITSVPVAAP